MTTRVQAQVLSGLVEGDQVITGLKLPPAALKEPTQRGQNNQGGGLQQAPGNLPGGGRGR